jgi:small subunit ribosomal protein S3Ae
MVPGDEESGKKEKRPQLSRTVKDKWRAKQWFRVKAPPLFQGLEIGETPAEEADTVVGRTMETTLGELTGGSDPGKMHIKLRFRIERIGSDRVAETRFIGHELTSDYIRRLARRKRSKIDMSLKVTTQDGVAIRLKPVAVSEQRLQARLRTLLRGRLRALLEEHAATKTGSVFVQEMLNGELGKTVAQGLRTLYPLKKIEIRASEIEGPIPEGVSALESSVAEAPGSGAPSPSSEPSNLPPVPAAEPAAPS